MPAYLLSALTVIYALIVGWVAHRGYGLRPVRRIAFGVVALIYLGLAAYMIIGAQQGDGKQNLYFVIPVPVALALVQIFRNRRKKQRGFADVPPAYGAQSQPVFGAQSFAPAPQPETYHGAAGDPGGYAAAPSGLPSGLPAGGATFATAPTHQPGGFVVSSGTMPSGLHDAVAHQQGDFASRPSGLPVHAEEIVYGHAAGSPGGGAGQQFAPQAQAASSWGQQQGPPAGAQWQGGRETPAWGGPTEAAPQWGQAAPHEVPQQVGGGRAWPPSEQQVAEHFVPQAGGYGEAPSYPQGDPYQQWGQPAVPQQAPAQHPAAQQWGPAQQQWGETPVQQGWGEQGQQQWDQAAPQQWEPAAPQQQRGQVNATQDLRSFVQQHPDAGQFAQHQGGGQFAQHPGAGQFARQPEAGQFAQHPDAGQFAQPAAGQFGQQAGGGQSGQREYGGQGEYDEPTGQYRQQY